MPKPEGMFGLVLPKGIGVALIAGSFVFWGLPPSQEYDDHDDDHGATNR